MTNQPYLAILAKDCPNTPTHKVHEHLKIGFTGDIRTTEVSAYSLGWCRAFAKALKEFIEDPIDKRCVHCAPQGEAKMVYSRRETVRRCAEVVRLDSLVDGFNISTHEDRGETYMKVNMEPCRKVESYETHLGARCDRYAPCNSAEAPHKFIQNRRQDRCYGCRADPIWKDCQECGNAFCYRCVGDGRCYNCEQAVHVSSDEEDGMERGAKSRVGVPTSVMRRKGTLSSGVPLPVDPSTRKNRLKPEPVRKGAQTSYKTRGKKLRQEEMFPDL